MSFHTGHLTDQNPTYTPTPKPDAEVFSSALRLCNSIKQSSPQLGPPRSRSRPPNASFTYPSKQQIEVVGVALEGLCFESLDIPLPLFFRPPGLIEVPECALKGSRPLPPSPGPSTAWGGALGQALIWVRVRTINRPPGCSSSSATAIKSSSPLYHLPAYFAHLRRPGAPGACPPMESVSLAGQSRNYLKADRAHCRVRRGRSRPREKPVIFKCKAQGIYTQG